MEKILIFYHCHANTGYAIEKLEKVFLDMALKVVGNIDDIYIGYLNYDYGLPKYLPDDFKNLIVIDTSNKNPKENSELKEFLKVNNIKIVFGFDQPVNRPAYSYLRKAGVRLFVSYWGAPMSSINRWPKLFAKKIEVFFRKSKPDHFIFESKAMAETAVFGRGINSQDVSVIPLGVDTDKYKPNVNYKYYAHEKFSIPKNRKIIFYSGHMEERKGVRVIVQAANELVNNRKNRDYHFVFLGNKNGEEKKFEPLFKGKCSEEYITFGGYQDDVPLILPSCYLGVIASTGWDSFTMSSIEMASSGLPLIVSALQGLRETIDDKKTGYLFMPGNYLELAEKIQYLLDNPELREKLSHASRERVVDCFSVGRQTENLTKTLLDLKLHHL